MSFFEKEKDIKDQELRQLALNGDGEALGQLIENHRDFLYNIVWRMVMNPQDAEDVTQDIIIKVITNLAKFRGDSKFRTWIYRIAYNHVINLPKRPLEVEIKGFDNYGEGLDVLPNEDFVQGASPSPEEQMVIDESMFGCTAGMLMCLDRDQRMVFVLAEIFEIDSNTGGDILEITPDNFRQKLSRARKQLYNFMQNKCGLINKSNPCRCRTKTKAFIDKGYVDPGNLQFNAHYKKRINEITKRSHEEMKSVVDRGYAEIYRSQPFQEKPAIKDRVKKIIEDGDFKVTFDFN